MLLEHSSKVLKGMLMSLLEDGTALLSVIPDLVFEMSPDGVYIAVSTPPSHPYSPETHGPEGGLVGKSLFDAVDPEGAQLAQTLIEQALATDTLQTGEWSRVFPDGRTRHYELRARATKRKTVISIVRDITDATDRAETLQALHDAMPGIICHVDREGNCLEVHGQSESLTVHNAGEPSGLSIAVTQLHRLALESDEIHSYRYSLDETHFVVRARRTRINTVVYVIQDETDQVQTLHELQRTNDSLQRFAYVASHDLQEPLRGMQGPARILLEELGGTLTPDQLKWLKHIHSNAERAVAMVRDMLEFSRSGTQLSNPEFFDGDLAIQEVLASFQASVVEKHATVTVKGIPGIYYDRMKFQAIIANLLSNALKFRRPGVPPIVEIAGRGTSVDMVTVSVSDNGIGIPREHQTRVLEPGFRLHHRDKYPGNGLGLSTVAMILDRCGGTLGIRSVVGQGSEFQLTLPGGIPHAH
jgi:signal transduction histidine kinase